MKFQATFFLLSVICFNTILATGSTASVVSVTDATGSTASGVTDATGSTASGVTDATGSTASGVSVTDATGSNTSGVPVTDATGSSNSSVSVTDATNSPATGVTDATSGASAPSNTSDISYTSSENPVQSSTTVQITTTEPATTPQVPSIKPLETRCSLTFNNTFNDTLKDFSIASTTELANVIEAQLTELYKNVLFFTTVQVTRFRSGSTVTDYTAAFDLNSTDMVNVVKEQVEANVVAKLSDITVPGYVVDVDKSEGGVQQGFADVDKCSVVTCLQGKKCEDGSCVNVCNHYCKNLGNCSVSGNDPKCKCREQSFDKDYYYVGPRCEVKVWTYVSQKNAVIFGVLIAVGIIFIMLIIGVSCFMCGQKKGKKTHSAFDSYDGEDAALYRNEKSNSMGPKINPAFDGDAWQDRTPGMTESYKLPRPKMTDDDTNTRF